MPIQVVCPGCRKRFKVSDQFAGREGPCPNCKATLKIPKADEQVKIHEPEQFTSGDKTVVGKIDIKPIARRETRVKPVVGVAIGAAALGVVLIAWMMGRSGTLEENPWLQVAALLVISPPVAVLGYAFLQGEEDLQPYRGLRLYLRATICALVYVILWGVFGYVAREFLTGDLWEWLVVAPLLTVGAGAALATLDLDFSSGFLHYCFYLLATILLRWLVGMGWAWQIPQVM